MKVEIRNNKLTIEGYVNVTNRDSRQLPSERGRFVEQISSGAFGRAIEKAENVDILFNHQESRKLGSIKDGNLSLREDNVGLKAKAEITDPEVIQLARENRLTGWSFGFSANRQEWDTNVKPQRRYVDDLELYEVSILSVTPAYSGTSIESRSEGDEFIKEIRSFDFTEIIDHDAIEQRSVEDDEEKRMLETIEKMLSERDALIK